MDFTDAMIREVLDALQGPGVQSRHAAGGGFDSQGAGENTAEMSSSRPAGRHYRSDSEAGPIATLLTPTDDADAERRLAMVEELSKEDELHVLTRDYIVAATNHVVRKLERAS